MGLLIDIGTSFLLGLLTPLTAVCVLPLYPAFLSFLSSKFSSRRTKEVINDKSKEDAGIDDESGVSNNKTYALFGVVIVLGVLAFMVALGLLFTTFLQESLTNVIGIVSPIAFGILGIISLFLIFNFDFSRFLPKFNVSTQNKHPLWAAFLFGFFFGAIVIPCNPAFIAAFFARALLFTNFFSSIVSFLSFGLGLGAPLLVFSLVSAKWSQNVIGWLTARKRAINFIAGLIMLGISVYYLVFVFRVFG